jgi:hypothetical protein
MKPDIIYADDVNMLGKNINTIEKNKETPLEANKEACLEVNTEKTKYMVEYREQNAGQNHNRKRADESFENVAKFKYFGNTVTNQNYIQE